MSAVRRVARAVHHITTVGPAVLLALLVLGCVALLARALVVAAVALVASVALWAEMVRADRADADRDPADCPLCARALRCAEKGGGGR